MKDYRNKILSYFKSNPTFVEILLFFLIGFSIFLISSYLNLYQIIETAIKKYIYWKIDDVFIAVIILAISLVIFTLRRWRQLGYEIIERKKAERKNQQSRAQLQAVLDGVPDTILQVDNNLRIQWGNKAAIDKNPNCIGQHCNTAFPGIEGQTMETYCRWAMETRQIEKGIRFQPAPGGTTGGDIYWEGIGVPLLLSDGRAAGAIAIARNVSDHMQVESTKKTLASLVESSFDAIIGESLDGTIHSWNSGAEKIFGYTAHEAIGKPVNLIFPSSFMLQMPQIKELVNKGQRIESSQIECMRKNGMRIFVSMTISPIIHLTGNIIGYSTIARDITAQKQAEDALVASEAKYRNLFEYSLEGIGITKGRMFISANKALLSIWGYEDAKDFLSISFVDHIHPDDRQFIEERLLKRSRGEWVSPNYEVRIIRKNKEVRLLEVSAGQLKIGNETFIQSTYRDITLRKIADEELKRSREQLRNLASHLEKAREAERKEIAYEVHDDLGQALTALKMDVAWLGRKFDKSNTNLIERVGSMSELIDETIQKIRRISTQLRPSILDHFGLGAAIEWLAEDFQKRTDISFKINIEPKDLEADELITISLFRICQESFTNITRHAQATTVDVSLILKNGNLELKVIDNGVGITVDNSENINSFGLIGMREKAFVAGGECIITGNTGEGTSVLVNLPYVAKGEYHD